MRFERSRKRAAAILVTLALLVTAAVTAEGQAARASHVDSGHAFFPLAGDQTPANSFAIVVGFVGGFVRHNDPVHSEVELAERLRREYPSGVDVETFESYRGEAARKRILLLLAKSRSSKPTSDEKRSARVILYGHSWGGSEAITVARELGKDGVPVLLTVQVDSVSRFFQNDEVIPPNVAEAVNFYQPDGFVHGESTIRAADPGHTKILGNFKFEYKGTPYSCGKYPWWDHYLVKPHTQIECDPKVWRQVENLIREALASGVEPVSTAQTRNGS